MSTRRKVSVKRQQRQVIRARKPRPKSGKGVVRISSSKKSKTTRRRAKPAPTPKSKGPGEYAVEAVVGYRIINGRSEYLIRWEGYSAHSDTWEPIQSLQNCQQALGQFFDKAKAEQKSKLITLKKTIVEREKELQVLERLISQAKTMKCIS